MSLRHLSQFQPNFWDPIFCINISAVTDPILTKLLGPNFLVVLIFKDQHFFWQNFSIFFGPKICLHPTFFTFLTQTFLGPTNLFVPKVFWIKHFFPVNFFWSHCFCSQNCLAKSFFWIQNFFVSKFFWSRLFWS